MVLTPLRAHYGFWMWEPRAAAIVSAGGIAIVAVGDGHECVCILGEHALQWIIPCCAAERGRHVLIDIYSVLPRSARPQIECALNWCSLLVKQFALIRIRQSTMVG